MSRTTRIVRTVLVAAVAVTGMFAVSAASAGAVTRMSTKTMLSQLTVAPAHSSGYDRSAFKLWIDADHDGCDTRREVLIAEATTKPKVGSSCSFTGGRWYSRYDGVTTTNSSSFDIDHLVPLAEAWRSGAWKWNADTRMRYANDLGYGPDLVAVSAHSNRSKGDDEPSSYLPPRCCLDDAPGAGGRGEVAFSHWSSTLPRSPGCPRICTVVAGPKSTGRVGRRSAARAPAAQADRARGRPPAA